MNTTLQKKQVEKQLADAYEHEVVRQHSLLADTLVWHWTVIPEDILYDAGYIHDFNKHRLERLMRKKERIPGENRVSDYGFDALAQTNSVYHGIQAKYYLSRRVTANDIGTFLAMQLSLICRNPLSRGYLYTTSKLQIDFATNVANPAYPIRHILHPWSPETVKPVTPRKVNECDLVLRDYQKEALDQLEGKPGLNALHIPCRMGKTVIAGHHIRRMNMNLILVIAPLKVSVENLQERLSCFFSSYESLLVDSDTGGTTDPEVIKPFLVSEKPRIIYSTFKSAIDVLSKIMKEYPYILVDEVHNASEELCEFITKFKNGLIMSATLPEEVIAQMEIEDTVMVSFAEGIKGGYLVDYNLWLPHLVTNPDGSTQVDIEIPIEFSQYDQDLTAKALYNAVCMLKTGSRRCIVYLRSKEECDAYMKIVYNVFDQYHGLIVWVNKIDSDVPSKRRSEILKEFQSGKNDVYHILTSVRILDEAVDIPKCDSVFITHVGEQSSDIRMMQRSQRSSTPDVTNPTKKNNIFLWAEGWEKCIASLELLKVADPEFHKKVRIADCNYDKSGESVRIESVKKEIGVFTKWSEMKCLTIMEKHLLMIQQVKVFYEKYGEVPKWMGTREENEKTLNAWISERRKAKKKGKLDIDLETKILTELQWWSWDPIGDAHKKAIEDLKSFYERYKEEPIGSGTRDDEAKLARWIGSRRYEKKKGKLDPKLETTILTKLPWWSWDPIGDAHKKAIEDLKAFYEKYQEEPKWDGKRYNEKILYSWISCRKQYKKKGKLDPELEQLILLTFSWWSWDPIGEKYKKAIDDLNAFYEKYKESPIQGGTRENEKTLANWIGHRRKDKTKGKLDPELEKIILAEFPWWSWDPIGDAHKKAIEDLKAFYEKYNEAPTRRGKRDDEQKFALWISTRRKNKKKGKLDPELERMILTELPWLSL